MLKPGIIAVLFIVFALPAPMHLFVCLNHFPTRDLFYFYPFFFWVFKFMCTLCCRYLSTCEADWRLFAYDIHVREPSAERLYVHLPNTNRIIYSKNDDLTDVVRNPKKYKTMLTKWFALR